MARWPAPDAGAAAPLAAVLREWQGLGYPRRARGLHDTARVVAADGWPDTEAGLRALPGVGAYTARALRVLASGQDSPWGIAVDETSVYWVNQGSTDGGSNADVEPATPMPITRLLSSRNFATSGVKSESPVHST